MANASQKLNSSLAWPVMYHETTRVNSNQSLQEALQKVLQWRNRPSKYGFVGMEGFWVVVTGWLVLRRRERVAARLLVIYWLWVIYDVAWTYALWQLN